MAIHVVFFYLMKALPDRIRDVVPLHVEYWRSRHLQGYSGGPFADRTGGMILLETTNLETAEALVNADPFATADLLDAKWVKEWRPE